MFGRSSGRLCGVLLAVVTLWPSGLLAQEAQRAQGNRSHWGVSFSGTPDWTLASQLQKLFEKEGTVDIGGKELTVGIVRGSRLGGDWGVSFVSKPFKDGSGLFRTDQQCFQQQCFTTEESAIMQNVKLTGVEVHWFMRLVNIKQRVQLGLNLAGGIANVSGTIVETRDGVNVTGFNPRTGTVIATPVHTVKPHDAPSELIKQLPLGKVEFEASANIAPALKVKVASGLNFPAFSTRVGLVYLFGAH